MSSLEITFWCRINTIVLSKFCAHEPMCFFFYPAVEQESSALVQFKKSFPVKDSGNIYHCRTFSTVTTVALIQYFHFRKSSTVQRHNNLHIYEVMSWVRDLVKYWKERGDWHFLSCWFVSVQHLEAKIYLHEKLAEFCVFALRGCT